MIDRGTIIGAALGAAHVVRDDKNDGPFALISLSLPPESRTRTVSPPPTGLLKPMKWWEALIAWSFVGICAIIVYLITY